MTDKPYSINVNILGKILGRPSFFADDNCIWLSKDRSINEQYQFHNLRSFIVYEENFFGGQLSFIANGQRVKSKFLNKNNFEFIDFLNQAISPHIKNYLNTIFNEWFSLVVKSYPRNSYESQIRSIISELHQTYNRQPFQWQKYLSTDVIEQIKSILSFYPLEMPKVQAYHEQYQLEERNAFFNCVEANPLTEAQRLGVLRSNDLNMVLAAAGTGKTSVMVAKALDLIERQLTEPTEVLVLAYNKTAAQELKERFHSKAANANISLATEPHISTFHALGRQILREALIPTQISVFAEDSFKLEQWVTKWICEYISTDPSRIFDLIELTTPPIDAFDLKSEAEYQKYIRDNDFRTLSGEKVRGYQELQIANFLHVNQIPYEYEKQYVTKRRIDVGFDYRPDFHLTDSDIYIEHYGVDRKGNTRPDIDAKTYNNSIREKRNLHQECGTTLIETYHYEWQEKTLLPQLKAKLASAGIACKPMSPHEIFEKLNHEHTLGSWAKLMTKALQSIRVERLDRPTIFARLVEMKIHNAEKYSELLAMLQDAYIAELKQQNAIDFDDMIIRAIEAIQTGAFIPKWKFVLVDEFQDISAARMEFIQSILNKGPCPSLTVVGDDWQSIYRFSGGKLELTTRFGNLIGDFTLTKLEKTFRYNNSIANTAGRFIMENPEQYKKEIVTHKQVNEPQVYLLDDKVGNQSGLYERTLEVVRKIRQHEPSSSIAVIARYNYLLTETKQTLWKANFKENIEYWSFHKSKGLEADYCILIGFFQGKSGFPNENRDDALIEALLPSLDSFPHSEERRLLYVGITRAKNKCYIIADPTAPSDFINELLAPKYELNIVSETFKEKYRKIFKCPHCKPGYLRLLRGQFGAFYSCSTGIGCKVRKARVCAKCEAPSIDMRSHSQCNNINCGAKIKICERCGRPMYRRQGKFGEFWGCSGYGIKDDQCTNTVN